MDHSFHPAQYFHRKVGKEISFVSSSFLPDKCVNITKKILPVNNTVTLNKDLITQAVINLFRTNVVLLVEVDLPTYFSSALKEGGCDIPPLVQNYTRVPSNHTLYL